MAEPMKPTDVPRDLAVLAAAALRDCRNLGHSEEMAARRMLAAVLPLHEQQVRAAVVNEYEQMAAHERWMRGDDD